jgi:hypothetical protein
MMPLDDVCGGCTTVPVAVSDAEQAQADVKALQWQLLGSHRSGFRGWVVGHCRHE